MSTVQALCVLLVLFVAGCTSRDAGQDAAPDPIGPPPEFEAERFDPEVAALFEQLTENVRTEPQSADARAALGLAFEANGRPEDAATCYRQAATLDPGEPRWRYLLALRQAGAGDLEQGIETIDGVIRDRPDYVPALLYKGSWALDLGRPDLAEETFLAAIEVDPDHPFATAGLARTLLKQGRVAPALSGLTRIVERYPDLPYFRQLLGLAYREAGDLDRAREELAKVTANEVAPSWPDPWVDEKTRYMKGFSAGLILAESLFNEGRYSESAEVLERVRPLRPNDVSLINNLSAAYLRLGRHDEARRVLLEGLEASPDYFPFHINLALSYRWTGDIDKALEHIDRARELNPNLATIHALRGQLLESSGREEEALESMVHAGDLDPKQPELPLLSGMLAAKIRRWPTAVVQFRRATELAPGQVASWIGLARALAETGALDEAEAALQRASAIRPDHAEVKRTGERIAALRGGTP